MFYFILILYWNKIGCLSSTKIFNSLVLQLVGWSLYWAYNPHNWLILCVATMHIIMKPLSFVTCLLFAHILHCLFHILISRNLAVYYVINIWFVLFSPCLNMTLSIMCFNFGNMSMNVMVFLGGAKTYFTGSYVGRSALSGCKIHLLGQNLFHCTFYLDNALLIIPEFWCGLFGCP